MSNFFKRETAAVKHGLLTHGMIAAFIAKKRETSLQVTSINRQLEVLRRMLMLATEWGKVEKALLKVERLTGENHRDRVLGPDEEKRYLDATVQIGEGIQAAYLAALQGIRALRRSEQPIEPEDPFLLRDVATIRAVFLLRVTEPSKKTVRLACNSLGRC